MTIGELEPELVSYATLRRHTFCFKGMKQCEFDHDPTDSRTLPMLIPAPRPVTCSTAARSSTLAHSFFRLRAPYYVNGLVHASLGIRHTFCVRAVVQVLMHLFMHPLIGCTFGLGTSVGFSYFLRLLL